MTDEEWNAASVRYIGVRLAGDALDEMDELGQPIAGDTLLILLNAHHESVPFVLPAHKKGTRWVLILDTAVKDTERGNRVARGGRIHHLRERSLAMFRLISGEGKQANDSQPQAK
jgi:glycogen operon protein